MMRSIAVTALIGALACATSLGAQRAGHARELLARSMQRQSSVNVIAIVSLQFRDDDWRLVKEERDKAGRSHKSILQPLREQGAEMVDDGEHFFNYDPHKNTLFEQESSLRTPDDSGKRMSIARRNYSFRFGERVKVAGRMTVCVIVEPRAPDMDTRRYYIDPTTAYPLKMETVTPEGVAKVRFETKDVQYPKALPDGVFAIRPIPGVHRIHHSTPTTVDSAADVQAKLGFRPVLPEGLSMGFAVQEMQVIDTPEWRSLAVRLTDGLVRVTVYEWKGEPPHRGPKPPEEAIREVGDVHLLLVSHLAPSAQRRILSAFSATAKFCPPEDQIGHQAYHSHHGDGHGLHGNPPGLR